MRFTLLDRVVAIEPGKSITAIKTLSLSEEYLADHFPCFPVMPGVLMLESMTQAAAWAIRLGEDFAHSIVVLREARNVKYGDFVEPGRVLTVTAEVQSQEGQLTKVKASGSVGDRTSLTARLVLERYNLADRIPYGDAVDARVRADAEALGDPASGGPPAGSEPAGGLRRAHRRHGHGRSRRFPAAGGHERPAVVTGRRRLFSGDSGGPATRKRSWPSPVKDSGFHRGGPTLRFSQ
jgi:3-hydroxyacyl-[acyl-carrier-protein] dehydratase